MQKNSEIGAPLIYWLLKGALPIESVLGMVVKAGYATAMSQKADSVDLIWMEARKFAEGPMINKDTLTICLEHK